TSSPPGSPSGASSKTRTGEAPADAGEGPPDPGRAAGQISRCQSQAPRHSPWPNKIWRKTASRAASAGRRLSVPADLRDAKEQFDVIVMDPPKFVATRAKSIARRAVTRI